MKMPCFSVVFLRFPSYLLIFPRHSSDRVFLDSDELQDLDSLFECVRSQVAYLVPLLTPGLMMRPWCVGELATAYLNKVSILPISCNGATLITPSRVPAILNSWTSDDFQPLLAAGIDQQAIEATAQHLASLKAIHYDRSGELESQEVLLSKPSKVYEIKENDILISNKTLNETMSGFEVLFIYVAL